MDCKSCWWQEGGKCYTGEFRRDEAGRSDKPAKERCPAYWNKREALETVIPGKMLEITSEKSGT